MNNYINPAFLLKCLISGWRPLWLMAPLSITFSFFGFRYADENQLDYLEAARCMLGFGIAAVLAKMNVTLSLVALAKNLKAGGVRFQPIDEQVIALAVYVGVFFLCIYPFFDRP